MRTTGMSPLSEIMHNAGERTDLPFDRLAMTRDASTLLASFLVYGQSHSEAQSVQPPRTRLLVVV
jgi:hypothetical protein